ncbi:MAG: DUF5063 domain-containing protein [Bacteroidales bacterium]|jgi:hypothetical protein|nr:DUF5063 domain-containing protein [Bacteroidales bacterium]
MTSQTEPFLEPENSLGVLEFLRVAHEYCIFIEKAGEGVNSDIYDFFLKIGPLLYLKGKLLPAIIPEYPETSERFVTEEEWQEVFNILRALFAADDEHFQVNYEEFNEYEAVKTSLSENFTDIYQDLKDFILLYQKHSQAARQNAVHDCKSLFENRWGPKVLSNLRYIHFLSHKRSAPEEGIDLA